MFNWKIGLIVLNPESMYYRGYFTATMKFPRNYPYSPPGTLVLYSVSHIFLLTMA